MTRAAATLDVVTGHGASSRLPGGGPTSRWSPRRVRPATWCGAGLAVVLAAAVALALDAALDGRLDPDTGAVVLVGLVVVLAVVLPVAATLAHEEVTRRPRDEVRRRSAGTTVTLRGGPVAGDDHAVAVVEVDGERAGVLRERAGRGRLGARRTLVLAGRAHTARWTGATDRRTGQREDTLTVRDAAGRVVAEATRFRLASTRLADWRVRVGERDLWLRVRRGHEPARRTLLDDLGRAWLSRPRRSAREHEVGGATTVLPRELGSWEAACTAWLLAEIERDTGALEAGGGGAAGDGDGDSVWDLGDGWW